MERFILVALVVICLIDSLYKTVYVDEIEGGVIYTHGAPINVAEGKSKEVIDKVDHFLRTKIVPGQRYRVWGGTLWVDGMRLDELINVEVFGYECWRFTTTKELCPE